MSPIWLARLNWLASWMFFPTFVQHLVAIYMGAQLKPALRYRRGKWRVSGSLHLRMK